MDGKQDHWYPNPLIVVLNIEDMNKMKMAVWLQHKMNHQDMGEKWLRRSHLVEEMINIFRDLDIEYIKILREKKISNERKQVKKLQVNIIKHHRINKLQKINEYQQVFENNTLQ